MSRQDKKLMMMVSIVRNKGADMRPKRHLYIVSLPYALYRRIFPSSQSNQPVSKFSSPNMLGLAYNRASSSSPPSTGAWSVRDLHVRNISCFTHVSLNFDGKVKTSISNILGRELSPLLDWRIATALSYVPCARSQMLCSHTRSLLFLRALLVDPPGACASSSCSTV